MNVLADEGPEHALHVSDDGVQIEVRGLRDLAAAKGEQLLGKSGGAAPGGADFLQGRGGGPIRGRAGQGEVAIAQDDGEQVVKVVRNAAGKASDGFHLLGLAELIGDALLVGDVLNDGDDTGGVARIAADQGGGEAYGKARTVLAKVGAKTFMGASAHDGSEAIGGLLLDHAETPAVQFGRGVAVHAGEGACEVSNAA